MRVLETSSLSVVKRKSPVEPNHSFSEWSQLFQDRQEVFAGERQNVSFSFPYPILLNLMSDLHIGHPTTNYKRIEDEINVITATANSFVIFAGDLINNMNWNPGQFDEMEQTPSQIGFIRSIFKHLSEREKLLHSIQGDHDGWIKKSGMDMQIELPEMGVSVSNGPTYFHLDVGEQRYEVAGAHQLPGHSIYNTNHPQMRAVRFGSMHGADVVFSGHNHKKGVATSYQHELGQPKETTYIALGPYKATDDWLAKKGWPEQQPDEMFGVAVYLNSVAREIIAELDIVVANERVVAT